MKINNSKKFLLASSVAMAMSQVSAAPTARIIGGAQATAGSYPWVVSLKDSNGDHFCGASLIDKQWVLTAAHCVEDETASDISVVVGEFNIVKPDAGEQKRKVTKIIMHPQYNKGADSNNDIALVKLESPVSNKVVTQVVPNIMKDIKEGSLLTVMGWGNQSSTGEEFPNRLFQVEVPLVSNQQCATNYEASGIDITEKMLCAGFKQGGKDSCQGDSGGPLLYQLNGTWQQVGIVSFGEGCALPDFPGVYARVEQYNSWVNQQIGSSGSSTPVTPEPIATEPSSPEPSTPEQATSVESTSIDLASLDLPEEIELVAKDNRPEQSVLKIKNKTSQTIEIVDISVNQSSFNIDQNNCVKALKPGKSCKINLSFDPEGQNTDAEADLIIDLADGTNLSVVLFGSNLQSVGEGSVGDSNVGNNNDENVDNINNINNTDEINDTDYAYSDDLYEDDFNGIDWYLDSDVWVEDEDGFSMSSTDLDLNDFATMSAEIDGGGSFEFDFDFENDSDENYCSYYVDGKLVRTLRGSNKSTTHHVTQLSKGKHEIMWVYKKKSENSGNLSIKNIKLSKTAVTPTATQVTTPTNILPISNTPNSLTQTSSTAPTTPSASTSSTSSRSGGGGTDLFLISALLLLLGRSRHFFTK